MKDLAQTFAVLFFIGIVIGMAASAYAVDFAAYILEYFVNETAT